MKEQDKAKLRQLIVETLEKLDDSIARLKEDSKPVEPDDAIGRLTRMDAIVNKGVSESALREAVNRRRLLQQQIRQIDDRDFGFCQQCGEAIPVARLALVPESTLCVHCAD